MKCSLFIKFNAIAFFCLLFFTNTANARGVGIKPVAVDDYASILQPGTDTINVTLNDTAFNGDTLCISAIYGSANFSLVNCKSILFKADTSFIGNDTCWYIVCDNTAGLCDTAIAVVTVRPDYSKWPVVSSFLLNQFQPCAVPDPGNSVDSLYELDGNGVNVDTTYWTFSTVFNQCGGLHDTTFVADTVFLNCRVLQQTWGCFFTQLQICETGTNRYGYNKVCDRACNFKWTGIKELADDAISIYPNPVNDILFVKTDGLQPEQTKIYNMQGQQISDTKFSPQIDVNKLTSGVYFIEVGTIEGIIRKRFVKM